jgi:mannose-6-phosphate isomerase-like protein (cupin superfamily)
VADYAVKKIDDMEAVFLGAFKRARAELGISSFGIQVMDLPPNLDQFPEHDHADDGQEEVYVVMRGKAEVEIDGERIPIDPDTIIRVSSGTKRKIYTGDEPVRILAIGGIPGKPYEPPDVSQLGEPDPMARDSN